MKKNAKRLYVRLAAILTTIAAIFVAGGATSRWG